MLALVTVIALAHHHAAPAFNGLFYATAATVIPVLFLALAVQGPTMYSSLLEFGQRIMSETRDKRTKRKISSVVAMIRLYSAVFSIASAGLVLLYGVFGEVAAVLALEWQREWHFGWLFWVLHSSRIVSSSVLGLVILVAARPAVALGTAYLLIQRDALLIWNPALAKFLPARFRPIDDGTGGTESEETAAPDESEPASNGAGGQPQRQLHDPLPPAPPELGAGAAQSRPDAKRVRFRDRVVRGSRSARNAALSCHGPAPRPDAGSGRRLPVDGGPWHRGGRRR